MKQKWFTIKEVAEMFKVTPLTIRNWIYKDKTLRAYKIGNIVRIKAEDIEKLKERIV